MQSGAHQRSDVVRETGLPADVVDAAIDHLVRIGRLTAQPLSSGCPAGGCSGCGSPSGHGCSDAAARTPGPVLISIARPPTAG